MTRTILVGYDGAAPAQLALDRAIAEARESSGHLVVLAVLEVPLDPEGPQNFGTLDDSPARMIPLVEPRELEPILAGARERIDAAGVSADYVWDAGEPATAIVSTAKDRGVDLIVVGKGHHGRIGRWLGTDTAVEVERDAGCPVIVVEA